jgi:hypothetical protein
VFVSTVDAPVILAISMFEMETPMVLVDVLIAPVSAMFSVSMPAPPFMLSSVPKVGVAPSGIELNVSLPEVPVKLSIPLVSDQVCE